MSDIAIEPRVRPDVLSLTRRVQAIAGSVFFVFVLLHLSNVMLAPFGVDAFNQYQRAIRSFYQYPLVELAVVVGPLVVHAICAIVRFAIEKRRGVRKPLAARLHTWAGVFLLVVIVGHVAAVRGPSFFYGVFPEFEGLSFSLWFFPAYFFPYYFLLALAGFWHGTNGFATAAHRLWGARVRRPRLVVTGVFATWVAISLMSLGGWFFAVPDPSESEFGLFLGELTGVDTRSPWK